VRRLAALVALGCGGRAPEVRFQPTGDLIYKVDGDLGHEEWNFAVVAPAGDVDRMRVEHRARGRTLHAAELAGPALAAYRDGDTWRDLHFRLPAAAAVDELRVELLAGAKVRARGRARLVRFEPRQRFRLPVRGCWLVSSGHDFGVEHRRHYSRGHFAWDLVRVDADGRASSGPRPEDHRAFGQPVLAPAAGVVVQAHGGHPDVAPGAPGKRDEANLVVIEHADGVRSRLLHLRQGSVRVAAGETVAAGQPIAEVGNSGASDAPHLHLHFERVAAGGEQPLPVQLSGYRVSWNQAAGALVEHGRPRRGQFICAE
jgi:hypothetical protein